MSACEVVAKATYESWENIPVASSRTWEVYSDKLPGGASHFRKHAGAALAALQAAGYRILGPDEVDAVTVEKCAKVADEHGKAWGQAMATPAIAIAIAIRALSSATSQEDKQ